MEKKLHSPMRRDAQYTSRRKDAPYQCVGVAAAAVGGLVVGAMMSDSGGGGAPGTDPNYGIAQSKLADVQKQQQDFFENTVYPNQQESLAKAMDISGKVADDQLLTSQTQRTIAAAADERMRKTFYPVEDSLSLESMGYYDASPQGRIAIANALGIDPAAAESMASNRDTSIQSSVNSASADARRSFGIGMDTNRRNMAAYGLNPADMRYQMANRDAGMNGAAIEAYAMNQARNAAKQLNFAQRQDVASLGRNLPSQNSTATGLSLNAGTGAVGAASSGLNAVNSTANTANSYFGGMTSTANAMGGLSLGQYGTALSGYNADQNRKGQEMAGIGQFAGTALSAYSRNPAAFGGSDIRIKENIVSMGVLDNGIPVYSFEYKTAFKDKWGHGRFVGVMAHEVEDFIPDAVAVGDDGFKMVDYSKLH